MAQASRRRACDAQGRVSAGGGRTSVGVAVERVKLGALSATQLHFHPFEFFDHCAVGRRWRDLGRTGR
eukprot:5995639-Pleurochrysis_carterae.AAC.1